MNFDFSDEQKELGSVARRYLAANSGPERVRAVYAGDEGHDPQLWAGLGELGLLGAAVPEVYGGAGAGYLELCVVAEELGRALAPVPFASSIALAAELILLAGSEEQKRRLLPELASGRRIASVAASGEGGLLGFVDGRLHGSLAHVPDAGISDILIVRVDLEGSERLAIVDMSDPAVQVHDARAIDRAHRIAGVTFDGVAIDPLPAGDTAATLATLQDRAAVLLAFEQVGGADRALEMARDYALERRAFGRQIGSFQAIKHMLADMFTAVTLARSNAYFGAWALASGSDQLAVAAATARVSATHAYELCAMNNIQTHGGIGFTWEVDCHLHYRRSNGLAHMLGSIAAWEDKLIRELDRRAA